MGQLICRIMSGPLQGVHVIELSGLGPAPFCGMVLADLGADVIQVDRVGSAPGFHLGSQETDPLRRGKRSIAIDLKHPEGVSLLIEMLEKTDILIEGFRPGVAERLGVGPAQALASNPRIVYGRMTGWGQEGPYSHTAGHDINYIAISGVLHAIGDRDAPTVPLNLVGDFGGGGMLLAVGVLSALVHARESGVGQVVDAAMVDGSALLATSTHGYLAAGEWADRRAANVLDGGAPFYAVYETSDRRHMAVGALEPGFFAALVSGLGVESCPPQGDRENWDEMRRLFADRFLSHTQAYWIDRFAGSDGCVAPVRSLTEAVDDPHLEARGTFIDISGVVQPGPAPRFSSTVNDLPSPPARSGQHTSEILGDLGYSDGQISMLVAQGAVA